jgi:hypothetical protein
MHLLEYPFPIPTTHETAQAQCVADLNFILPYQGYMPCKIARYQRIPRYVNAKQGHRDLPRNHPPEDISTKLYFFLIFPRKDVDIGMVIPPTDRQSP